MCERVIRSASAGGILIQIGRHDAHALYDPLSECRVRLGGYGVHGRGEFTVLSSRYEPDIIPSQTGRV